MSSHLNHVDSVELKLLFLCTFMCMCLNLSADEGCIHYQEIYMQHCLCKSHRSSLWQCFPLNVYLSKCLRTLVLAQELGSLIK